MISFLLNDQVTHISDVDADLTLLNYLREQRNLTGTKEGCASGDCGACTVVLAEPDSSGEQLQYRAINSCVTFLSALQGKQLVTVEHLSQQQQLHPVQQAMVDHHGSQCGFCTPGFVMSMFAMYHQDIEPERENIDLALSGNLCRCTGYRPIIDAAKDACSNKTPDQFDAKEQQTLKALQKLACDGASLEHLHIPRNRSELAQAVQQYPNARLFAGSTDLALEATQQYKTLDQLISLTHVEELRQQSVDETGLTIGAAVTLAELEAPLLKHYPELQELLWRFASTPIRNQATLGGNVANASPIGDFPPVLLALNAEVLLDNGDTRRQLPIKDFFLGYRQTALQAGEWVEAIRIPLPSESQSVRAYKVSKRMEDDISAVCAVFNVSLDNGNVSTISTGFGGVAAIPETVAELQQQLQGKAWQDSATMEAGKAILAQAFTPIDDVRATAAYRNTIVANLWHRFWLETNHQQHAIETRVTSHA